jgi:site-specific recombinase XerD
LKAESLDLAGGMVTLKGKRNKVSKVPLAPECAFIIKSWMEIRNVNLAEMDRENPYVFVTTQGKQMSTDLVRQMMGRMKKQIGGDLKRFHPHKLRHTSLTKMCNTKDVNLRDVRQIAGHSSLVITECYKHVNLDQIMEKFTKNLAC